MVQNNNKNKNARTRLSSPRRKRSSPDRPTNQQDRFHSLVVFTRKIVTNVPVIDSRRRAPETRPGTPSSNIQICRGNFFVREPDDEGRQKTGTRSRRIYTDLYLERRPLSGRSWGKRGTLYRRLAALACSASSSSFSFEKRVCLVAVITLSRTRSRGIYPGENGFEEGNARW